MTAELSNLDTEDRRLPRTTRPNNEGNPLDTGTIPLIPDNLPQIDGGRQAWIFCLSASMLEMLVWGYGFSFGVFQDWYTSHPPFQTQFPIAISAIGASALGIQYFEGLGLMALIQTRPQWMRRIMWLCLGICTACLLLSSFATQVLHLSNRLTKGMAIDPDSRHSLWNGGGYSLLSSHILGTIYNLFT
jgi:H+/Cl- antiporter ClcA